ncbi:MAG: Ca-activated chloride channel family protein [Bradymonadia bacterium]|jgi:Ca-activated chloride channel family protein
MDIGGGSTGEQGNTAVAPGEGSVADAGYEYEEDAGSPPPVDESGAPVPEPPVEDPTETDPERPEIEENDWVDTAEDNLATFSIDVDTASYTLAEQLLIAGQLPDPYTVRTEEFINYFDYGYAEPKYGDDAPFSIEMEAAPSYFGDGHQLLRVSIQAAVVDPDDRLPASLVFLVDTSGSMSAELPLVQESMRILLDHLHEDDSVAIVSYAQSPTTVLNPTPGSDRTTIEAAIDSLASGGSTGGEGGIRAAYDLADSVFVEAGVNRVILTTDGDFNVGLSGQALWDMISDFRERDIYLTGLLVGTSAYGDTEMEFLTNLGNGNYYAIANVAAAREFFDENFVGILQVVAKDVKIQVELNPEVVARYRIVGYDNRVLEDWEFNDDTRDAGEVGAGQNVTAFIEYELHDGIEDLSEDALIAAVNIRYKPMGADESVLLENTVLLPAIRASFDDASDSFRWAAAVTELAEILKGSMHTEGARFEDIEVIAAGAVEGVTDPSSFLVLLDAAAALLE